MTTIMSLLHRARGWAMGLWKVSAIAVLCLAIQIPFASATAYYISSSQGNDTNSGTSANAPWQSLNKVYNKCISASKFQPGDSILLNAGDTFEGLIQLYGSGSNGAPIYIGRYGSGDNPIICGDNTNVTWTPVGGHRGVYTASPGFASQVLRVADVSGNLYTKVNQGTNTFDAWLGTFGPSNWGFTFATNNLIYIRTSDDGPPAQMRLFEYCGILAGANYTTIENMDIRRTFQGIVGDGVKGLVIKNSSVQDALSMGIYCGGCTACEIASNTVARTGWTSVYLWWGGGNWIHGNNISNAQTNILGINMNGAELCGIGLESGTNNLVERNKISNVTQGCVDYYHEVATTVRYNYGFNAASAGHPDGTGLKVCYNVFNLNGGAGLHDGMGGGHDQSTNNPAPDAGPILIYNNVIYGLNFRYGWYSTSNSPSSIILRNNIFVSTGTTADFLQAAPGLDIDYTIYYCAAGSPRGWNWTVNGTITTYTTLGAFRAATGQDAHSVYANPQFVSANPVVAADFQLKPTSPCIDAGQDLKLAGLLAPAAPYQDYLGAPIPQGAGPDIGAYEYNSNSLPPPTNLHRVLGQ